MSAATKYGKLLRVSVKEGENGVYVATSPSLKGLLVVSKNFNKLIDTLVPQAIVDLYAACNEHIVVAPLDEDTDDPNVRPFVAVPAEVARQALELASRS
jgi:hypothetical protein